MKLLFFYLRKHRGMIMAALVLATINQAFSMMDPQIFRLLVDNYASRVSELTSADYGTGLTLLLLGYIGVALVSRVAKNIQDYYVNVVSQSTGAALYEDSMAHAFALPYAVFEDQRSGELLNKIQKARTDSQAIITSFINTIFLSAVGIVITLGYAFYVHWIIGAVYVVFIPILGGAIFIISRRIREAQKEIVKESADLAGSTTETIRNVELVKGLGLEQQEVRRLNIVNRKVLALELKKIRFSRVLSFIQGTITNVLRAVVMGLLLWLIFKGQVTLGEFFTLLFYSFYIFAPLGELGTIATQYQEARASMEQIDKVLAQKPEAVPTHPKAIGTLQNITFNEVTFTYADNGSSALKNINVTIIGGQTVAFVGPSGSGKSTLAKLIVGLYQPQKGLLTFNGTPSTDIDFRDLRKRISLVTQETQLFSASIRENLRFVKPDATDKECLAVLKDAAATAIIERGDRGLDTKIGEGGINISGGERQRLAIARALLRNPELLIFDEATSSLDSLTEKEVSATIARVNETHPHLMVVLIAHRLSTIVHADHIYVLRQGLIVEHGRHGDLKEKANSLYAALWLQQQVAA